MSTIQNVILQIPDRSLTNNDVAGNANIEPSKLGQKVLAEYVVPIEAFKTWDAVASNLPASAASDDLGLVTGTWLTNSVRITAGDCKNLGATTRRAYFSIPIPPNYDDGETIQVRIRAAMETTLASTACTVDLEAVVASSGTPTADLVTTAAQSMNSLTAANFDFTITAASVDPGQLLECRLSISCNDTATATAVVPAIYKVSLLADTRG
jgi:hypothetical protein